MGTVEEYGRRETEGEADAGQEGSGETEITGQGCADGGANYRRPIGH